MVSPTVLEILFIVMALALATLVGARVELTRARGGKILAFVTLFITPVLAVWLGFSEHMERAESTQFCLSCHVMHDFGRSLYVDDPSYIPAKHFQNNLVPRDRACYTCHTDYTMFGTVHSKFRGLRHLYVQYLGTPPAPADIKLYTAFNNRECLHCHAGMRAFEEQAKHSKRPDMMAKIMSNQMSCMNSGCHDIVHEVGTLKSATFWNGVK
ncbi:MAG TPA: NapC/NirT family cytochrome c [Terriglobales bacterium]|jgi:cytochrome c-type protein NapC|nr:NapC/NirT family cytochrome c [Terriglobales bacterium]